VFTKNGEQTKRKQKKRDRRAQNSVRNFCQRKSDFTGGEFLPDLLKVVAEVRHCCDLALLSISPEFAGLRETVGVSVTHTFDLELASSERGLDPMLNFQCSILFREELNPASAGSVSLPVG
jgi:hypothetical protein